MVDPVAFLGVSLLVIVTPGQDTALTIRNSMLGGWRGGVATAGGVVAGQLCWALAASLGLAAMLLAWQPAFVAMKLAGAAYLISSVGRRCGSHFSAPAAIRSILMVGTGVGWRHRQPSGRAW